jgi:mannonate dehydratase
MLTPENFAFAKQAGATHIIAHLVDYFRGGAGHSASDDQPLGTDWGWGLAGDPDKLWTLEELKGVRTATEAAGLKLEAIENFDPAHWGDILLDGPKRAQHIENVKTILRRMGEAGIPIMGYNFSIAGVAGRTKGNYARGDAPSVGMEGVYDLPMPNGLVWNMVVDPTRRRTSSSGRACSVSWTRCSRWPKRPACGLPCTRTIRRCRSSAASRASSTSRRCIRRSSTSTRARRTSSSSASARSPR